MAKYILSAFADEAAPDLAGQIAALKANGLSHIELRMIDGHTVLDKTEEELLAVRRVLDEAGITVSSLGSPIGKYDIEADFEPQFTLFCHAVKAAKILGTARMRIFSFFIPAGKHEQYREEVISRLTRMTEYAKAEGVTLCHENEAGIYGDSPARVADLLAAVPELRAIFDAANYLLLDFSPLEGFEKCREKLEYLHVKDALGLEKTIVAAGEGEGFYRDILCTLGDASDATYFLTLEAHLNEFAGYGAIDDRQMKHKYEFASAGEAFAYGMAALRKTLKRAGYEEKDGVYTAMALRKIRFGILGLGVQGTEYSKQLSEGKVRNGVIGAVADTDPKAREKWIEKYGSEIPMFEDIEGLLSCGVVDCILIEVPHYDHPEMAIKCMRAGIPVIVEKPAGVYTKQVEEMYAVAKETGVMLGIMFNQRTTPHFCKMRQMIADGELGEIKRVNWIITNWYRNQNYYESGNWRGTWDGEGGGVLYNQAPHNLDLFQWIIGMTPSRVRAFCHYGKWHNIEVEDDVTAYVEFPNGATGTFITSTADNPGTNRFEVLGSKGALIFDSYKLTFRQLSEDEREYCFNDKETTGTKLKVTEIPVPIYGKPPQHSGIMRNVVDTLLGLDELYADGFEGINGVALANAMHLSDWEDRMVSLPIDGNRYLKHLKKKIAASKKKK